MRSYVVLVTVTELLEPETTLVLVASLRTVLRNQYNTVYVTV